MTRDDVIEQVRRITHDVGFTSYADVIAQALADAGLLYEEPEGKVECPRVECAYSFVGNSRAQELIDHYDACHRTPPCELSITPRGAAGTPITGRGA